MRFMFKLLVLVPIICTTAALALPVESASVMLPFGFETQGKSFPAGQYDVTVYDNPHFLIMRNRDIPTKSLSWEVGPAEHLPHSPALSIKFDFGTITQLRTIRLGAFATPVLDQHETTSPNIKALAHTAH
ncbi:hypothetical protein [Acidisarcina polymorpha]|uniref:hypothetical protein n=1 Tax=Acidisarcina polymorpha TaxID=2211140 RepID=UPI000DEFFC65|nr:hypothetical protein [Acidisarcina polymorpha]